jgi:hypothetical protein
VSEPLTPEQLIDNVYAHARDGALARYHRMKGWQNLDMRPRTLLETDIGLENCLAILAIAFEREMPREDRTQPKKVELSERTKRSQ